MALTPEMLLAVTSAIVSLIGIALQFVRWNGGERVKLLKDADGTVATAAQTLTGTSLELVEGLRTEVAQLRTEVNDLRADNTQLRALRDQQVQELQAEINELRRAVDELHDYADRLVHQVRSLGHEPVKPRAKDDPNAV